MVIDTHMDKLPPNASSIALTMTISCDAVAYPIEFTELFYINVHHLAGPLTFVADHRFRRFQIAPTVQAMAHQSAADGAARETCLVCNAVIGSVLPAQ